MNWHHTVFGSTGSWLPTLFLSRWYDFSSCPACPVVGRGRTETSCGRRRSSGWYSTSIFGFRERRYEKKIVYENECNASFDSVCDVDELEIIRESKLFRKEDEDATPYDRIVLSMIQSYQPARVCSVHALKSIRESNLFRKEDVRPYDRLYCIIYSFMPASPCRKRDLNMFRFSPIAKQDTRTHCSNIWMHHRVTTHRERIKLPHNSTNRFISSRSCVCLIIVKVTVRQDQYTALGTSDSHDYPSTIAEYNPHDTHGGIPRS